MKETVMGRIGRWRIAVLDRHRDGYREPKL
jgi:hypothetical protein